MNLFNFLNRQRRWSRNTFGDAQRTEGILRHIENEIAEIRENPDDIKEWADVVILALDGAWRRGFTPHDICQAIQRKQDTNMAREWNVATSEEEPCEHVKVRESGSVTDTSGGIGENQVTLNPPAPARPGHWGSADTRGGWNYDTSRATVEGLDRTVLVAAIINGKPSVITASFLNGKWRSSSWAFEFRPFAWRELPEPPPLPAGWAGGGIQWLNCGTGGATT